MPSHSDGARVMTVFVYANTVYANTAKQIGDAEHIKATVDAVEKWFGDPGEMMAARTVIPFRARWRRPE
jgi:hypothetical protein